MVIFSHGFYIQNIRYLDLNNLHLSKYIIV